MSKPIYDKNKQLKYIKSRLQLISYMIDNLEGNTEETDFENFQSIEAELKNLIHKTKVFNYRNNQK